jgi:hypothetical protein
VSGIQEAERVAAEIALAAMRAGAASATFTILRYDAGGYEQAVRVDATWLGTTSFTFAVCANGEVLHMVEFGLHGFGSPNHRNWVDVVAQAGDRHRARLAVQA